jgi:phosphohistidine phosphatase SixA
VRLFIVRHAEAAPGEPDELRPLTPAGRELARELGTQLAADGIRPDAIVSSPFLRARETAAEIGKGVGVEPEADDALAPGAAPDAFRALGARGETVVAVGHQPDCGRAAAELGGGPEPRFPPGGMVAVEL